MKQELIDRMETLVRHYAVSSSDAEARAIVAELDKPDYLVIAREICAHAIPSARIAIIAGSYDNNPSVKYALEQIERAAGLRA